MVSYRLVIGIIVGICFSFLTVFFFNMDNVILRIELYFGSDPLKVIILMIGANFEFDIISFFTNNPSFLEIFSPQILASIFIGYLSGSIVKGVKRGLTAGSLVVVVDFLIVIKRYFWRRFNGIISRSTIKRYHWRRFNWNDRSLNRGIVRGINYWSI